MDNNNFNGQSGENQQSVYSDYSQSVYSAPTPEERPIYQTTQSYNEQPQYQQPVYQQPVYQQAPNSVYQGDTVQYQQSPTVTYQQNYGQVSAMGRPSIGMGIASMVLGIVSLVFTCTLCISFIIAILAIVFGIVQLVKGRGAGKGFCIAGLITGGISTLLSIILFIGFYSEYQDMRRYGFYRGYDSFIEFYLDEILD